MIIIITLGYYKTVRFWGDVITRTVSDVMRCCLLIHSLYSSHRHRRYVLTHLMVLLRHKEFGHETCWELREILIEISAVGIIVRYCEWMDIWWTVIVQCVLYIVQYEHASGMIVLSSNWYRYLSSMKFCAYIVWHIVASRFVNFPELSLYIHWHFFLFYFFILRNIQIFKNSISWN